MFIDFYHKFFIVFTHKFNRFNFFWNSIISFSFNNIIDTYDEEMGENEFHILCDMIDEYREAYYKNENTEIHEKEIFNKLNLFIGKPEAI